MGLPKALTGSIVMAKDSANGALTFVEVQEKKKNSLHRSTTGMFLPFAVRRGVFEASGVTFAQVWELFSNVSKVYGSHVHLLNCYAHLRFHTDFT